MKRPVNGHGGTKYSPLALEATATIGDEDPLASPHCRPPALQGHGGGGTQSKLSATTNLAKCICGAGSFALPHVFLEEGVLGGTLALTLCGGLAAYTMQSLAHSQQLANQQKTGNHYKPCTSYVELAQEALGNRAAQTVFFLTLSASMGVCSTYLVFIGQTLESLSCDKTSQNIIRQLVPNVSAAQWEIWTAVLVVPLSLLRSYGIFAFTSALGVVAVLGGILVTLASGIFVQPGGGILVALQAVANMPMWPQSLAQAFGGSFGTIAYLFCINFLTFPILNSMEKPKEEYASAVNLAVAGVWVVNVLFAILCLGFYGDETQDLVLGNLDNGPYLSALKLLLCVDLLFTFPIVFAGGRQILELALLRPIFKERLDHETHDKVVTLARTVMVTTAIATCWGLTKIGGFGTVANLVGGVAQGTLAFVMPPAIAVALARRNGEPVPGGEACQLALAAFGMVVVSSVAYFTAFP